jgi:hypothetical protein
MAEKGKKTKKAKKVNKAININLSYDDDLEQCCKNKKWHKEITCKTNDGCGSIFYFLGFIGAAIYYISTATGFWMGVLGFLKAIVWPAFLVFELLSFLL